VAALLVFTAVSASIAAARYKGQFERASRAEALGREKLFSSHLAGARASRYSQRPGRRFASLSALAEAAKIRVTPELRDEAIASLALADLDEVYRSPYVFGGVQLAFAPDLDSYARLDRDGGLTIRRVEDDAVTRRFPSPGGLIGEDFTLAYSPDGRRLVVNYPLAGAHRLTVWDLGREEPVYVRKPSGLSAARFGPNGNRMAMWDRGGNLEIADLASGRVESYWDLGGNAHDVAFSPDGRRLAVGYRDEPLKVQIRSVPAGKVLRELDATGWSGVAWHPDGKTLAVGSSKDRRVYLYNADTGSRTATLSATMLEGVGVRFQPVGGLLASLDWEGLLRVWRPESGELLLTLPSGYLPDFSPDGLRLATTQGNRTAIFRIAIGREFRTLVGQPTRQREQNSQAATHPGGRLLAVATDNGVGFWDIDHDIAVASLQVGQTRSVAFEPSGDLLTEHNKHAVRWRVRVDEDDPGMVRIGPPELLPFSTQCVALGGGGRLFAVTRPDGAAVLDVEKPGVTVSLGPQFDVRYLAVSPDGHWAATVSHHGSDGLKVWSLPAGRLVKQFPNSVASWPHFSPDGRWLMTNLNLAESCRLWSVGDWRAGPRSEGIGLGFSPDGRLLVVGLIGSVVRLIETQSGRVVANLEAPHPFYASGATFSADGARLILPSAPSRATYVWDLRAVRSELAAMGLDWKWPPFAESNSASDRAPLRVSVDHGGHDFSRDSVPSYEAKRVNLALDLDSKNVEALLQRARLAVVAGRLDEAVTDYSRVLALLPNDYRALRGRSAIYLSQKRYLQALTDRTAEAEAAPAARRAEAFNNLAWLHVTAPPGFGDAGRALDHARQAVTLAPAVATYRNTLGIALSRLSRDREAVVELEMSLARAPRGEAAFDLYFLASSHHRLGDSGRAKVCYERALRLENDARLSLREREELEAFRLETEAQLRKP
jgi:eukaryotic-like serine/threonine-protein kinase